MKNVPYHIAKDYRVLHHDEFPILFSGLNAAGERIVGSFIEEHAAGGANYFHALVREQDFFRFLHQDISYRDLLKGADRVYLLTKSAKGLVLNAQNIKFSAIPADILALASAFCPSEVLLAAA